MRINRGRKIKNWDIFSVISSLVFFFTAAVFFGLFSFNLSDNPILGGIISGEIFKNEGVLTKEKPVVGNKEEYANKESAPTLKPDVYVSSGTPEQGDVVLIKISGWHDSIPSVKFADEKIGLLENKNESSWTGIIGIDAKMRTGKYGLTVSFPDGPEIMRQIEVIKRNFPITELVVTEELKDAGYTAQNITDNIVKNENPLIWEVYQIYSLEPFFDLPFAPPLKAMKDVGSFGNIRKSGGSSLQHLGVDLDAKSGTPIYAMNGGVVRFAKAMTVYGNMLIIDHGLGIFSAYLHLSKFAAKEGDNIEKGEIIGLSGNTGYSIEPHLHLTMKVNGASVDPLRFIDATEEGAK